MISIIQKRQSFLRISVLLALIAVIMHQFGLAPSTFFLDSRTESKLISAHMIQDELYYVESIEEEYFVKHYNIQADVSSTIKELPISGHVLYYNNRFWYQSSEGVSSCDLSGMDEQTEVFANDVDSVIPLMANGDLLLLEKSISLPTGNYKDFSYAYVVFDIQSGDIHLLQDYQNDRWEIEAWNGKQLVYSCVPSGAKRTLYLYDKGCRTLLTVGGTNYVESQTNSCGIQGIIRNSAPVWIKKNDLGTFELHWIAGNNIDSLSLPLFPQSEVIYFTLYEDDILILERNPISGQTALYSVDLDDEEIQNIFSNKFFDDGVYCISKNTFNYIEYNDGRIQIHRFELIQ